MTERVDQSRGGLYIDDGTGPVHVDDMPKSDAPTQEDAPAITEPTPASAEEHTDA